MHSQSIFHLPFAFKAHKALIDKGSHVWMHVEIEFSDAYLVYQFVDLSLKLVGKQNTRLYLTSSEACWATFLYVDINCGAYSLTCYLHQPELA